METVKAKAPAGLKAFSVYRPIKNVSGIVITTLVIKQEKKK